MRKIISLFQRDYEGTRLVYDEVVPGGESQGLFRDFAPAVCGTGDTPGEAICRMALEAAKLREKESA